MEGPAEGHIPLMRHPHYELDSQDALALLAAAETVHLATMTRAGAPVLRALHAVVLDGAVWFHGGPDGEKAEVLGQPAVVSAEHVITSIPSYFVDARRACPATTYYRAAQAHGRVTRIDDRAHKARVLTALMAKHQPEGGFEPLEPEAPLYANMLDHLLIFGVPIERLEGKKKLGQNRSPKQLAQIVERLWQRGARGDDHAIEALLEANPSVPVPEFLRGPGGLRLHCALDLRRVGSAVDLVADEYWNRDVAREVVAQAHRGASAWVGASDDAGRLVATARAVSDGAKFAYVADVAVARERRGTGLGRALLRLLLDHPAVRRVQGVRLGTADATEFYRRFGFTETSHVRRSFTSIDMVLLR